MPNHKHNTFTDPLAASASTPIECHALTSAEKASYTWQSYLETMQDYEVEEFHNAHNDFAELNFND